MFSLSAKEKIDGFVPIRSSTLVSGRRLAMDIFVPVDGRTIRYAVGGVDLDGDRWGRLKSKKQKKVWIRSDEEPLYRAYLEEILKEAETNSQMPMEDRTEAVAGGADAAAESLLEKPADKGTFLESQSYFEKFSNFLKSYESSLGILLKASTPSTTDAVSHGARVAALSQALADEMGLLPNPKMRTSLMTGCYLHDLAIEQSGLHKKSPKDYTPEELELWKRHPVDAARIYGDKDFVDQHVIDIILQHEEVPNGSGFPKGLTGPQMSKLAIVVSLVNRFEEYAARYPNQLDEALKVFTTTEVGRYDLAQMEALKATLRKAMSGS